ncbi:MAG: transporter substrate-binding domain-containing protein, partial [Psychromonas sp.]
TSLKSVDHYEDALLQILSGEADALIADLTICELLVIRDVNRSLSTLNKPLAIEEIGIAVNKGEEELKRIIKTRLDILTSEGELKNYHTKWFDDPSWLALLP